MAFDLLNGAWLALIFIGLGLFPGTRLTRFLALPTMFGLPLVFTSAALIAYGELWLFFFAPAPARTASALILLGSLIAFVADVSRRETRAWLAERDVWLPAALVLSVTLAYLAFFFWPGRIGAARRFEIPLALEDNLFSWWFADRLYYGFLADSAGRIAPLTAYGLFVQTSDRPPLQTAVLLAVRNLTAVGPPGRLDATSVQIITTLCQTFWVAALYTLGRVIRLRRGPLAFALIGAVCSGFFLLNSLYTWPKLLAASLLLTALALFIHLTREPGANGGQRRLGTWSLIGGASGLALLAHGGPAFSLLAAPLFLFRRDVRRALRLRPAGIVTAAVVGLACLAPWGAYQAFVDPPGNMLVKAHLAGVWTPDARSTPRAIADAYARISLADYAHARWENVKEQWFVWKIAGPARYQIQWQQFYHHVPALDALLLGLAAFFFRRFGRRPDAEEMPDWLVTLTWYALATIGLWICLSFSPGTALIHHGSYAATALLIVASAIWLRLLPRAIAYAALGAHIALFIGAWLLSATLPGVAQPSPGLAWRGGAALLMTLAFVAFAWLLTRIDDPVPAPSATPPVTPASTPTRADAADAPAARITSAAG